MVSLMTSPLGMGFRELFDADGFSANSTTGLVPLAFRRRKVWRASGLRQPFAPTPWMIAIRVSVLSALTGVGFAARPARFPSSSTQFPHSPFISASPSGVGLTATPIVLDPAPLKIPTRKDGESIESAGASFFD